MMKDKGMTYEEFMKKYLPDHYEKQKLEKMTEKERMNYEVNKMVREIFKKCGLKVKLSEKKEKSGISFGCGSNYESGSSIYEKGLYSAVKN